jgi:hypothetical protein
MVGQKTGYRGKHDAAEGSRQRHLHHVVCGKTLGRENEEKDRHDDDAAADPKEARKNSGDHPEGRINQPFRHRVFFPSAIRQVAPEKI